MNFNPNSDDRINASIKRGDDLDQHMVSALRNALVIAKEKYEAHRVEFQGWADQAKTDPKWAEAHAGTMVHPRIYQPMAVEFAGQVKDVQALIDWLDGPEDGEVKGREIAGLNITRRIILD